MMEGLDVEIGRHLVLLALRNYPQIVAAHPRGHAELLRHFDGLGDQINPALRRQLIGNDAPEVDGLAAGVDEFLHLHRVGRHVLLDATRWGR